MAQNSCPLCNFTCTEGLENEMEDHKRSGQHQVNYLKYFYTKHRKEMLCQKEDIELQCMEVPIKDFTIQGQARPNQSCEFTLAIKNCGTSVLFTRCEFLHAMACRVGMTDDNQVSSGSKILRIPEGCDDLYYVKVTVSPTFVGIYQSPLLFQFSRDLGKHGKPFYLGVEIIVICSDDIVKELESLKPYVGRAVNDIRAPAPDIEPGIKPKMHTKMKYEVPLKRYKIDPEVAKAIAELQEIFKTWIHVPEESRALGKLTKNAKHIYEFFLSQLSRDNYQIYFNLLLNCEEVQMDIDIRKYDMKNVTMYRSSKDSSLLTLRVLGLAEKRPSVLKGDRIFVRIMDEKENREYEGYVHFVQETEVLLGFGPKLMQKFLPNLKFHVRFQYNKMPTYVMLRGLEMVNQDHIDHWLFPTSEVAAVCRTVISPTENFVFYNRNIEKNYEQATAIKHIVAGSSLPAPFLLHGPPGTGKTVTLVEAIMQIWKLYNKGFYKAYVLVCTPSNSASDLIVERLLKNIPGYDVFRFYSMSREFSAVPIAIKEKKCLNYDFDNKRFFIPTKEALMKPRIVISTLCNSSRLVSLGIKKGHFTHVFLDESGHAVEPEALSPLVGLLDCRIANQRDESFGGQIVLAGDPKQLGPVIRCRVAEEFGLSISILERLMNLDIYKKMITGQFNPRLLTRLRNNYRSHPAILDLPNKLFYEGELKACADELKRKRLCHWEGFPRDDFPVLFHGVIGRDMQEKQNPSFFNPQEISVVITYVEQLLGSRTRGINIQHKDIGIISPYRQQVCKIRNELRKKKIDSITVGSVDEFQGQEYEVVIISTVRSDPDLMSYDTKYKLGFLKNPKRFNVALTRAKCGLIVIGNPNLLSKDKHWNEFLKYCLTNGSYVGARYDSPEDEIEDVLQRFVHLSLYPVEKEPVRISQRANQEDPEWRNDY